MHLNTIVKISMSLVGTQYPSRAGAGQVLQAAGAGQVLGRCCRCRADRSQVWHTGPEVLGISPISQGG